MVADDVCFLLGVVDDQRQKAPRKFCGETLGWYPAHVRPRHTDRRAAHT